LSRREQALVLVCFFLSGVAALVYQIAWTRQFAFVFGTSQLAIATVLAAYMGGLASGAAAAGRLAPRLRRPVLAYGCLELGIAAAAILAVPAGIRGLRALHAAWLGGRDALPAEGGLGPALFYAAGAFAILWLPTALMGATLPLLARHAVRDEREIGSKVGLLYATNTAGAVVGALVAGFLLLPRLGLGRTLQVAALLNLLVFAAAALLTRGGPPAAAPHRATGRRGFARRELVLPFIALSGAASFGYEVLWSRLLGLVLGGSVPAFATMLAVFLVGIALGSAVGARIASSAQRSAFALGAAQLGTAACSVLAFLVLDRLPFGVRANLLGFDSLLVADAVLCATTLLPSTLCIGATFPLAVRVLARDAEQAGPASARVYAWNTLGALAGAIGAGFFAIPALGFEGSLALGAALNLLLAAGATALVPDAGAWRRGVGGLAATGLAALALARPAPPWNLLRSSSLIGMPVTGRVVHAGVGRSASVLLVERNGAFELLTDGLPESTIQPRGGREAQLTSARWLGVLPTLARPETRSLLAVGLGGGTTLEDVPASVASIDVVELETEVIRANRAVAAARRRDPLADPRVRLVVNDARSALLLTERRYDAIVSQPSHPWTLGASHLYTREFFELARDHLAGDGVLVQWMGLAFVDEPLLRSLVATLTGVFSHVEVYRPEPAAVLFLASQAPFDAEASARRAIASAPEAFADLGIFAAADVIGARVLDAEGARRFAEAAPSNTDDRNLLLMRGLAEPRLLDPQPLFARFDPLAGPSPGLDRGYLVRRLLARGLRPRAALVAETSGEPAVRETALGLVALDEGRLEAGQQHLERALTLDPGAREARFALLRQRRRRFLAGEPRAAALAAPLDGAARAVVTGWAEERRGNWTAVEALEPALTSASPVEPYFEDAARLRVGWRVARGGTELAREALPIADALVVASGSLDNVLLRAEVAARAGEAPAALHTLYQVALNLRPTPAGRARARRALAVVAALPPADALSDDRALLEARLRELAR
jgi:spermidine synthase